MSNSLPAHVTLAGTLLRFKSSDRTYYRCRQWIRNADTLIYFSIFTKLLPKFHYFFNTKVTFHLRFPVQSSYTYCLFYSKFRLHFHVLRSFVCLLVFTKVFVMLACLPRFSMYVLFLSKVRSHGHALQCLFMFVLFISKLRSYKHTLFRLFLLLRIGLICIFYNIFLCIF